MLKRKLVRFLKSTAAVLCAVAVLAVSVPYSSTNAAAVAATTTDYLNLRQGAGTNTKIILTLVKNAQVTVLDDSNSQWVKVRTASGYEGYCARQYLKITGGQSSSSSSAGFSASAKTTTGLNMRSGPSLSSGIVTILSQGVSLKVLDNSNDQWVKVQTPDGRQGWCSRQYLSMSSSQAGSASSGNALDSLKSDTPDTISMKKGAYYTYRFTGASNVSYQFACAATHVIRAASLTQKDGSYYLKVYAEGVGEAGIYAAAQGRSQRVGVITVSDSAQQNDPETSVDALSSLKSDTPNQFSMKQGAYYTYLFTGISNVSYQFVCAATHVIRTASLTRKGGGYYLKIYAEGVGEAGIYASAAGKAQRVGVVTVTGADALTATTTDYLNLREGPGQNYNVILTMSTGAKASVLDNSNSEWVKVLTSDGKQGWCSRQYVTISASQANQTPSTPSDSDPQAGSDAVTGATVTASLLRLRSGAGTSYAVLDSIPQGTYLKVLEAPQSGWVKVQTSAGKTGYVSADYVTLLYNGDTGSGASGGTAQISATSATVPQGKTLWLTSAAGANWTSSNPSVAAVSNGYVTAVSTGTAKITAACGSSQAVCTVTVTVAEPVRATFASPNIVSPGAAVTLTAVTDSSRDGVRFRVATAGGGTQTLAGSLQKTETTSGVVTKVWTASTSFPSAGTYSYTAYSSLGGAFSQTGVTSDIMVATQGSESVTTSEQRRASDKMLNLIAGWEGYSAAVYADQLASSRIPTIGYGYTFGKNTVFYNNISRTEAWAQLVNTVNRASYTTELNRMITKNHFRMNQNQADALISFAYNVGSGYFNSSNETGFRRIMKNAVVPPDIPSSGLAATVTADTEVRSNHALTANTVCSVSSGTSLTVTGTWYTDTKDVWYAVRLQNGTTGWVNSGYVNLSNSASLTHDLNYTNAYAFGTELILWNQAGGKFIPGLFYRRLGEANVYNYGDYSSVDSAAAHANRYNYTYPASASYLE